MDIDIIQLLYNKKAVVLSEHFLDMLIKRGVTLSQVKAGIASGKVIEQYPDDYPHPSALILGYTNDGKPLHIVVGMGDDVIWFVTTYYPDSNIWESDYKTRRVRL